MCKPLLLQSMAISLHHVDYIMAPCARSMSWSFLYISFSISISISEIGPRGTVERAISFQKLARGAQKLARGAQSSFQKFCTFPSPSQSPSLSPSLEETQCDANCDTQPLLCHISEKKKKMSGKKKKKKIMENGASFSRFTTPALAKFASPPRPPLPEAKGAARGSRLRRPPRS